MNSKHLLFIAASVAVFALVFAGVYHPVSVQNEAGPAVASMAGTSNNTTVQPQNPAWSEMNAHIKGVYPQLDLYLRAPVGIVAPMLNNFQIEVNSPGNSTVSVMDGSTVFAQASGWSYNKTLNITTSLAGTVVLVVNITSFQLHHSVSFRYILDMMTPQQYVNYEGKKTSFLNLIPYNDVPYAFLAGGVIILMATIMIRRYIIKPTIRENYDRRGLIRSG